MRRLAEHVEALLYKAPACSLSAYQSLARCELQILKSMQRLCNVMTCILDISF